MRRLMIANLLGAALLTLAAAPALALQPTAPTAPPAKAPDKPAATPKPDAPKANSAIVPVDRKDEGWVKRQESFNARARQGAEKGDIDVIFIGDSITQGWEGAGKPVWEEFYGKRNAVNFGIGGDRTQHVLWRIEHGNLDGLAKPKAGAAPRLVVLMIGTNNSNGTDNTAAEIAAGIKACVAAIHAKLPATRILLLSVFPRGEKPNPQREKNAEASRLAAAAADGKTVLQLDIGDKFLESDGSLKKEVMPDFLHLSEDGYRRWASAIEPKLQEILGKAAPAAPPTAPK
jgi:beta-glucosidase